MGFDVIKEHGASTHLDGVNKTWLCLLGTACGGLLEPGGGIIHHSSIITTTSTMMNREVAWHLGALDCHIWLCDQRKRYVVASEWG